METPNDIFRSVRELKARVLSASFESFSSSYGSPALVVTSVTIATPVPGLEDTTPRTSPTNDRGTHIERSIRRTTAEGIDGDEPGGPASMRGKVVFLAKRPGNPFPAMVTVGRALNNDIALNLASVSKVHAYFLQEGGRWTLADQRSANGTFLNGERLVAGARPAIADGDKIQIGTEIRFEFHSPRSLYTLLRGG